MVGDLSNQLNGSCVVDSFSLGKKILFKNKYGLCTQYENYLVNREGSQKSGTPFVCTRYSRKLIVLSVVFCYFDWLHNEGKQERISASISQLEKNKKNSTTAPRSIKFKCRA